MESMVQRVVRQARETNLTTHITVATNANQFDIITNQLGDQVSVVTEPERGWGTYRVLDDTIHIPVEHHHAIKALTEFTFIEVLCGNPLIEEDIERFDFNW